MWRDREFLLTFLKFAIPVAVQSFFVSSLGMVDSLMVSQLGENAVAAVNLANQVFFILNYTLFGITTGAAIFIAQYWGGRDVAAIRRVMGMALSLALSAGGVFLVIALFFPTQALGLYTHDPLVLEAGVSYMQIISLSYLATTITVCYATTLRSTGNVRLPMLVAVGSLALNTSLNYLLIFGNFGFPALGVRGAAMATAIARLLECAVLLMFVYRSSRPSPAAAHLTELLTFDRGFAGLYLRTAFPVLLNELLWGIGTSGYQAVYARLGAGAVTAVSIATAIYAMGLVIIQGGSAACSIMVGNQIGAGRPDTAYRYAKQSIVLALLSGIVTGLLLFAVRDIALSFYHLPPAVIDDARAVLVVLAGSMWIRGLNPTIIVGILRSGGDTRYSAIIDVGAVWLAGLPTAALLAFVFNLPVYWVACGLVAEGVFKASWGLWRISSKKWINNFVAMKSG